MEAKIVKPIYKKYINKSKVECSLCNNTMDKALGDIQIENQRINAPICPNCIVAEIRDEDNKPIAPDGSKVIYKQLNK
jgi:uncharacterized protein CbrC (UPF0167 family)